jgi:hypothetical protein
MKPLCIALMLIPLAGCGVGAAATAGGGAATIAPPIFTAVHDAVLGVKTLTAVEQTACHMQSIANSLGRMSTSPVEAAFYAKMSTEFGEGCLW